MRTSTGWGVFLPLLPFLSLIFFFLNNELVKRNTGLERYKALQWEPFGWSHVQIECARPPWPSSLHLSCRSLPSSQFKLQHDGNTTKKQTQGGGGSRLSSHANPGRVLRIWNGILWSARTCLQGIYPCLWGHFLLSFSYQSWNPWHSISRFGYLGPWHGLTEYICGYSRTPAASCFIKEKRYIWLQSLALVRASWWMDSKTTVGACAQIQPVDFREQSFCGLLAPSRIGFLNFLSSP